MFYYVLLQGNISNDIRCYCTELLTEVIRKTPIIDFEASAESHPPILVNICSYLTPSIISFLTKSSSSTPTYLGKFRLLLIEHLEVLWRLNTRYICDQITKSGVLNNILDLFFAFKWNNFLHDSVHNIIVTGLQYQYSDFMYPYLFSECNIAERILKAEDENNIYNENGFKRGSNLGFIGHITRISWLLDNKNNISSDTYQQENNEDTMPNSCGSHTFIKNDTILLKWKEYIKNIVSVRLESQSIFLGSQNDFNCNNSSNNSNSNSSSSNINRYVDFDAIDYDDNDGYDDVIDNSMSAYGSFDPSDFYSRVTKEVENEDEIYDNYEINKDTSPIMSPSNPITNNNCDDENDGDDDPIQHLFYEFNTNRFAHLKMNYNFNNIYNHHLNHHNNSNSNSSDDDDNDDDDINSSGSGSNDDVISDDDDDEEENSNEESDKINDFYGDNFDGGDNSGSLEYDDDDDDVYNDGSDSGSGSVEEEENERGEVEDASDAMIHTGIVNIADHHHHQQQQQLNHHNGLNDGHLYINDDGEYAFFDGDYY